MRKTFEEFAKGLPKLEALTSFRLKPDEIYALCIAYEEGKNTNQLGKQYCINKTTVCNILRACGIEPARRDLMFTPHVDVTPEKKAKIIEMYKHKDKPPISTIAKEAGLSYHLVRSVLQRAGLRYFRQATRSNTPKGNKEQMIKDMCKDWEKGNVTKSDLAKIYKVTVSTVEYWLYKKGYGRTNMANKKSVPNNPELTAPGSLAGEFRKLCKNASPELLSLLMDRAKDPEIQPRDLAAIFIAVSDRGYGKPKDNEEAAAEAAPVSASDRILKALPPSMSKIFNQS